MCGIVGIRSSDRLDEVQKMLSKVAYRGPDAVKVTHAADWTIGHARLSVIDVMGGAQPMIDQASGAQIVYNGEIYNYQELRAELGGSFQTESDTEVILRFYASGQDPVEWLPKLKGMFAFAIIDQDRFLLARDPMGIKPLYVGAKGDHLAFGSEIKALLDVTDRIIEFPPGHVYTPKLGTRRFRTLTKCQQPLPCAEEIAAELLAKTTDSVCQRLIADVPVGVFLSGGLDSSIIAAIASRVSPHIKTFAVGMKDSSDLLAARQVAAFLETDHYERVFTFAEAVKALPNVIYHLESYDASLVRSAIPNYFLAELAAQHVKVALSGEGADELFAGYSYLKAVHGSDLGHELDLITNALHFTNLQRCDRMSMAHGLEVRVPFLGDLNLVEYAMAIPVQYKLTPRQCIEKWILRKAVEGLLPDATVWRKKEKFADGAGLGTKLAAWADRQITNERFQQEQAKYPQYRIRDKEELAYFLLFKRRFPAERVLHLVGRTRSA